MIKFFQILLKKLKSIGILNILYIDIMKKKKVIEYKGTKAEEIYSSKSAMMKHEKTEGKAMEKKEKVLMRKKKK